MYSKNVIKNKGPINKSHSYLRYKKIEDSDTDSDIMHSLNWEISTQEPSNGCVDAGIEVTPHWSFASFIF